MARDDTEGMMKRNASLMADSSAKERGREGGAATCMILNPGAGGGETTEAIRELAAKRPWIELGETERPGDAVRMSREAVARGASMLIVAGGDGALSEVVEGLSEDFSAARVGLVPAGTGNDFARTLGIPPDPAEAMELIERGRSRRIDVVRVRHGDRTRHMINMATGGFSALLDELLDPETKRRWGRFAYLIAALQCASEIPVFQVELVLDDRETLGVRSPVVVVANGRYAGGLELAPLADEDDRRLDLAIVTAETFAERAQLAGRFAAGTHLDSDGILFRRVRRVSLVSDPPMGFHADGEPIGETPLEFEILPGAVEVMAP